VKVDFNHESCAERYDVLENTSHPVTYVCYCENWLSL